MVDEVVARREVEFLDLGYFVVAEAKPYVLDVTAYSIYEMSENGQLCRSESGRPFFVEKDVGGSPVAELEKAEVALNGFVKWDGCSNWTFGSPDVMTHFCSKQDAVNFGALLGRLYDLAAEMVPRWQV